MPASWKHWRALALPAFAVAACAGSSHGDAPGTSETGRACQAANECYANVAPGALLGVPACLTQVQNGYCTHGCSSDADCCAAANECPDALPEVCAPFESTGALDCFLSCEPDQVTRAGFTDDTAYCQKYASAAFICRSTGGGANNRKVCLPGG